MGTEQPTGRPELSGRCMCGAVTWESAGETTRNLICHCGDCQRATSAPITAFLGFLTLQVRWTGSIEHYESSPGTFRGFCPICGTRLYFRSYRWPGETHVHAATLTDPTAYRPDAQVFVTSRAAWLEHLEVVPAHESSHQAPAAPLDEQEG